MEDYIFSRLKKEKVLNPFVFFCKYKCFAITLKFVHRFLRYFIVEKGVRQNFFFKSTTVVSFVVVTIVW